MRAVNFLVVIPLLFMEDPWSLLKNQPLSFREIIFSYGSVVSRCCIDKKNLLVICSNNKPVLPHVVNKNLQSLPFSLC